MTFGRDGQIKRGRLTASVVALARGWEPQQQGQEMDQRAGRQLGQQASGASGSRAWVARIARPLGASRGAQS